MRRHLTILLVLIFGVALISGLQGVVTLPVTDNFPSTGTELSWEDYDSAYNVIESFSPTAPGGDGYVLNVNDGSGWQVVHLTDDDGSLGDYTITAYIYVPTSDGTNWGRVGVYARAQGTHYTTFRNSYMLIADSDADDCLRVVRYYDNGAGWDIYFQGNITRSAWHKFELSLMGSEIIGRIDDVEVYSDSVATDFTTGYIGIMCFQQTTSAPVTYCDRITITPNIPTKVSGSWSLYE